MCTRFFNISLLSLLCVFIYGITFIASDDVESFMFRVTDATTNIFTVTLWFNHSIYQFSLTGDTVETITVNKQSLTVLTSSNCDPQYKIMLDNNDVNGIGTDSITVTTSSGDWFGITAFCGTPQGAGAYDFYVDDSVCPSDQDHFLELCVDNELGDAGCAPYKQIFYFDITRPKQYITDAAWMDATDVIPEIITCHPTTNPTQYPTINPIESTQYPTINPIQYTTQYPTIHPIQYTTQYPTDFPTKQHDTTAIYTTTYTTTPYTTTTYTTSDNKKEGFDIVAFLNSFLGIVILFIMICILVILVSIALFFMLRERQKAVDVTLKGTKVTVTALDLVSVQSNSRKGSAVQSASRKTSHTVESCDIAMNEWIENTLALPQYVHNFTKNGYYTLYMVQGIKDKAQLIDIGISNEAHQRFIMLEIGNLRELVKWLADVAEVPQYLDVFIQNGYHNMEMVQGITERGELEKIGVSKMGHQKLIMTEIYNYKLRQKKRISSWVAGDIPLPEEKDDFEDSETDSVYDEVEPVTTKDAQYSEPVESKNDNADGNDAHVDIFMGNVTKRFNDGM